MFGCKGLDVGGGGGCLCFKFAETPPHLTESDKTPQKRATYIFFYLYKKYEILYSQEANCIYA